MGHASRTEIDRALSFARQVAPSMLAAAEQHDGVNSAELPMATFVSIAQVLTCLSDAVEQPQGLNVRAPARSVPAATPASAAALTRAEWIATLSSVETMSGDSLAELLAPAEIAEIVEAVIATQASAGVTPELNAIDALPEDSLDRLFAAYSRDFT